MKKEKYACKTCGSYEFVSNPNRYDIFVAEKGKLILKKSEFINEENALFCRECSEKLIFVEEDLEL
jgi:DNA-directed RNA polymerase subunit RPC12/RpoP